MTLAIVIRAGDSTLDLIRPDPLPGRDGGRLPDSLRISRAMIPLRRRHAW
jgi:hypothetical protein